MHGILHDAGFHVEFRMTERGLGIEQTLPDVQGHAGVGATTVPVLPENSYAANWR
jgi:hypothetical protein